jgi:Ala-tRNA(Pro) deacylase
MIYAYLYSKHLGTESFEVPCLKIKIEFDKLLSANRSMSSETEQKVYEVMDRLGIAYTRLEHAPVFTVEQAEKHWGSITGAHCKNLFLRNKKGNRHYLAILESSKSADLKALTNRLGEDRLSFASPERLMRYLGLEPGAVSPFGLINDSQKEVQVVVDQDLKNAERINFHPNVNTATVGIDFTDFENFLDWCGNSLLYLKF